MTRDTRSEILAILAEDPEATGTDIARRVGVSRQRVHQVMKGLGKTSPGATGSSFGMRDEYKCWHNMIARCVDTDHQLFRHYGGRGIAVCQRWMNSFSAFLTDMGPRPSALHSIDRINNDGNYEPGNCRWATAIEQNNNRRNNRKEPVPRRSVLGQPPKVTDENRLEIERAIHAGERIADIATRHGMSEGCLRTWYPRTILEQIRRSGPLKTRPKQQRKQ